jgi:opacity protein-like surface antigen
MRKWLFSGQIFGRSATAAKNARRCGALLCSLTATFAVAATAHAQGADDVNEVEITPFIGYMVGGEFEDPGDPSASADDIDRDLKEDQNFGVIVNLNADGPDRQYELLYSQQDTQIEGDVPLDLKVEYLQIGGIVNFMDNPRVIPFFGITVGGARFTPDGPNTDSETKLAFSVGGGLKIPVTDHIGIRLDTRAFISLFDTDATVFCVSNPSVVSGCSIRAKSDTVLQFSGNLGITIGF